ncbi:unnamed protein product, partial [Pylaiella littoralis]
RHRRVKTRRYRHREIVCKRRGKPRKDAPGSTDKKLRKSSSKQSNCDHNHDPRGAVSSVEQDVLPLSVVERRMDDLRRWTPADTKRQRSSNCSGWTTTGRCYVKSANGRRVVLQSRAGSDFLSTLQREPGMFVERTFDSFGRLVNVFWATVDQQDKMGEIQGLHPARHHGILEQVVLSDADIANTSAVRNCWQTTLHLFCLWHVFKNVLKNCAKACPDADQRAEILRLFRSAAYAATPEAFLSHRANLERIVEDTSCEKYIADLIAEFLPNFSATQQLVFRANVRIVWEA